MSVPEQSRPRSPESGEPRADPETPRPSDETERLSPEVVAALYAEHASDLRAFLVGVLRDADLAGDVVQATFVRAAEVGHESREKSRRGWLFRVAYNEAMRIKRRGKVHQKSTRRLAWNLDEHDGRSGQDNVLREESVERVREALTKLPDPQRQVVRMRIYEEKTFAVIAEELGCPLGTVLTRMRLAMKKLAGHLEDDAAD